jgi:hypothetical protein
VSSLPSLPEHAAFAYLLLTHKDPAQVEELAQRILDLSPGAQVVVHHDAGAPAQPWAGRPPDRVHLVERGPVTWGDWSMLDATLRMLRFAKHHLRADWFVLLSGEHRPTVDLLPWEASTAASGNDALLGASRLPNRLHWGRHDFDRNQYLARSLHRWWLVGRPRHPAFHYSLGLLMKLSARTRPIVSLEYVHRREAWAVGVRRRTRPVRGWTFFRGSQWFALNRRAALAALSIDPGVVEWFTKSWIPDEAFLHTALRRDPDLVIADTPTTFVLDTPAQPYPGWMRLSLHDLPAAWASGLPFARKVDPLDRPEVVARIDEAVDRQTADQTDHAAASGSRAQQRESNGQT